MCVFESNCAKVSLEISDTKFGDLARIVPEIVIN